MKRLRPGNTCKTSRMLFCFEHNATGQKNWSRSRSHYEDLLYLYPSRATDLSCATQQWPAILSWPWASDQIQITLCIKQIKFILCNITPCSPLKVSRHFRETCLHLQGWTISQARNQHEAGSMLHVDFLIGLSLNPDDGGDMFIRNVGWLAMDDVALYPGTKNSI
jgi:hypothetical protein